MMFTMPRILSNSRLRLCFFLSRLLLCKRKTGPGTRLDASPRHHEYVAFKHGRSYRPGLRGLPEVKTKAPVVVLIHEIFGLSDWAKEMADELAAQGFIVIAPDLLSGFGPHGGGSSEFSEPGCRGKGCLRTESRHRDCRSRRRRRLRQTSSRRQRQNRRDRLLLGWRQSPSPSPPIAKISPPPLSSTVLAPRQR